LSEFRVLGPVEAAVDGRPVRLPASKPRALLAVLLLNRNRVVATDTLIDALWEDLTRLAGLGGRGGPGGRGAGGGIATEAPNGE
jgi:hypothetical protein